MCNCKNIKVGSYNNQIELDPPIHMFPLRNCLGEIKKYQTICVDKCISNEIIDLWKCGITTIGCCCGHNEIHGYIQVAEKDKSKMIEIGYKIQGGCNGSDSCFIPKTKYMKKIVKVQSYISKDDNDALERIVKKYNFKSRYQVIKYLIDCFLRVADPAKPKEPMPQEIEDMFEGYTNAESREYIKPKRARPRETP